MSSDVYIDIIPEQNSTDPNFIYRIGHLGLMSYFATDLVSCLRIIAGGNPVVNEHVISVVSGIFDFFRKDYEELKDLNPEYIRGLYGYYLHPEMDLKTSDEVSWFLNQHINKNWKIRID